jgi:hypothetical protein
VFPIEVAGIIRALDDQKAATLAKGTDPAILDTLAGAYFDARLLNALASLSNCDNVLTKRP